MHGNDGMDCWCHTGRAADGRGQPASVVIATRTRIECGERIICQTALGSDNVVNSTADQLNGLHQSYHPQHTLNE